MTTEANTHVQTFPPPADLAALAAEVFRTMTIPVVVVDRSLSILHRNQAAADLFGPVQSLQTVLGAHDADRAATDWRMELRRVLETAAPQRYDALACSTPDGKQHTLDVTICPLATGANARDEVALITAEDATQRTSLERSLAASRSMAVVGRLAARVAHELNNPLDGTLRYINLCVRLLESAADEKVLRYLGEARQGLTRMAQIVGELLEFSRSNHAGDGGNINWIVEEAIHALQDQAERNNVVIAAAFQDQNMPEIHGAKLFQVCCNLIKNAIDAMPEGGCLTITTTVVGGEVIVRFEDTGVGLPDDVDRIFEPFYTTKPPGEGTGLGLAICKDYIEQLDGRITAGSGSDGGAVFTVRMPSAACDETRPVNGNRPAHTPTGEGPQP